MFKFTIRELLLFTVIAGLAVAWGVDHAKQQQVAERFKQALCCTIEAIEKSGYRIESAGFDDELDEARGSIIFMGRGPRLLKSN
ncbi:MAG TPA: hypothetical protein VMP01_12140 [Pirellulaceae bacterium]|nr:hypothetical protein [Pirellulaceae bacterium]